VQQLCFYLENIDMNNVNVAMFNNTMQGVALLIIIGMMTVATVIEKWRKRK